MKKIGTHNSGTGERVANLLSWLLIPFCRTQGKTISEQYDAGARMFDIRIRKHGYMGTWHLCHGLFVTKKTFHELIFELELLKEPTYVMVTYEGRFKSETEKSLFLHCINSYKRETRKVQWGPVCVKYVDGDIVPDCAVLAQPDCDWPRNRQGFLPLDGHSWHTYLPIPWLWKKIYHDKPELNEEEYTWVDFL